MKQTAGASLNTIQYQALIAYVCVFSIFICFCSQCGQSSRSQVGWSNLDSTVDEIFQKTLNLWRERSQVPPKHSKVSSDHFGWWLETSNHPPFFAGRQPTSYLRYGYGYRDGCLFPAANQSGRSSLMNVSRGTCDISSQGLRIFWKFCFHFIHQLTSTKALSHRICFAFLLKCSVANQPA